MGLFFSFQILCIFSLTPCALFLIWVLIKNRLEKKGRW